MLLYISTDLGILGTIRHVYHAIDVRTAYFPAFAAVPIVWWILYRTTIGFEVRTEIGVAHLSEFERVTDALLRLGPDIDAGFEA